MSSRSITDPGSSAVPQEEIDEITDRIELIDSSPNRKISRDELNAVMASFEQRLLELNQILFDAASGRIMSLRAECEKTAETVEGLNLAIDERLKGHG